VTEVFVRDLKEEDRALWWPMWLAYCRFYDQSLPDDTTEFTWSRILDPQAPINAIVATDQKNAFLGFANYVLRPTTWSKQPVCYLEDLFVYPHCRKSGVGRALMDKLLLLSKQNKWARVDWVTHQDNQAARRLYDSYVKADGCVRYVISTNPELAF